MNTLKSPIQILRSPTLDSKKKRESFYNKYAFHGVRLLSFISAIIVGAILTSFAITLWSSDYNIPWTFLLAVIASYLTVICWVLSMLIMCCTPAHPILNLVFNAPLSALWIASSGIIIYNLLGTLSRSCSVSNWGNSDGIAICNIYKLMFSACIFATLSQLALVVLDVIARRDQNRSGRYTKMDSTTDLKMEPVDIHRPEHQLQTQLNDQSLDSVTDERGNQAVDQRYRDEYIGWQPEERTRPTPGHRLQDTDGTYSPSVYSQPSIRLQTQRRVAETHELAGSEPQRFVYQPYRTRDVDVGTVRMEHYMQPTPGSYHDYQAYQPSPTYDDDRDSYLDRRY